MSPPPKALRDPSKRVQILLVDDHPMVRERLAEVINREADLAICGEAEDRHQAIELFRRKRPDLAIVDLTLKNSDGLELIKDAHTRWPALKMLVVSMHEEALYAERAIRAGACGYITKQEATHSILRAIRTVLDGTIYVNNRISTRIISRLTRPSPKPAITPPELLADRELQVFELTGRGLNTRQIADRLHLGIKTVETYRARMRLKLGVAPEDLLPLAISWVNRR